MLQSIGEHWHCVIWDIANIGPVFGAKDAQEGPLGFVPYQELRYVILDAKPVVSPAADVNGELFDDISVDSLVFVKKLVDHIPKVKGAVVIQIKCIKVLPQAVPTKWLQHTFHVVPVELSQRIAHGLYLVPRPEMNSALGKQMLHLAKWALAILSRENGSCARPRLGIEAQGKVVLDIGLGDTLGPRCLEHLVDVWQSIRVEFGKCGLQVGRLVLGVNPLAKDRVGRRRRRPGRR